MKAVISGGGTGGHIYPGLAIATCLKEKGYDIHFIGTKKGLESKIIPENGFPIDYINVKGFKGKSLFNKIIALILLPMSVLNSLYYLLKIRPEFVIITGGYVSLPVSLAALLMFKKVYLQEQNAFPGLVNRISAKFAKHAFTGFKDRSSVFGKKEIFTGNPVRKEFLKIKSLKNEKRPLHLLITGGSQGSFFINSLIEEVLPRLLKMNIEIVHLTGEHWYNQFKELGSAKYTPIGYANNMAERMEWSDLILSRSGASLLAEVGASGRPLILIPLPTASDNHQYYNALSFVDGNAAILLEERNATADKLFIEVEKMVNNRKEVIIMGENAKKFFPHNSTEIIVNTILGENN